MPAPLDELLIYYRRSTPIKTDNFRFFSGLRRFTKKALASEGHGWFSPEKTGAPLVRGP
jgi:hypothetical protein